MLLRATPLRDQQPFLFPAAEPSETAAPCREVDSRDLEGQGYTQPQSPVIRGQCSGQEQLRSCAAPLGVGCYPRRAPKIIRTYSKKKTTSRLRSWEISPTPPSCVATLDDEIDESDSELIWKRQRRKRAPVNGLALVSRWMGSLSDIEVSPSIALLNDILV